jgi:hypothetical protein
MKKIFVGIDVAKDSSNGHGSKPLPTNT